MDAPAGHPSPVDFSIKTRCSPLDESLDEDLAERKPVLIARILQLNQFYYAFKYLCSEVFSA